MDANSRDMGPIAGKGQRSTSRDRLSLGCHWQMGPAIEVPILESWGSTRQGKDGKEFVPSPDLFNSILPILSDLIRGMEWRRRSLRRFSRMLTMTNVKKDWARETCFPHCFTMVPRTSGAFPVLSSSQGSYVSQGRHVYLPCLWALCSWQNITPASWTELI